MSIDKKEIRNAVKNFLLEDMVYFNSNERLNNIFSHFDFNEKEIFSVLGSGDQAFNLINRGASRVDLFDRNNNTFYYFYLRLWAIKYYNLYYFKKWDSATINNLLKMVKPYDANEEIALYFWRWMIKSSQFNNCWYLTFIRDYSYMDYNVISDTERLGKLLESKSFKFDNIDLTDKINFEKKYDYVVLSNIMEWLDESDNDHILNFSHNIRDLLSDDGIAVCSVLRRNPRDKKAREILCRDFDIHKLNCDENTYYPGYYLTKK